MLVTEKRQNVIFFRFLSLFSCLACRATCVSGGVGERDAGSMETCAGPRVEAGLFPEKQHIQLRPSAARAALPASEPHRTDVPATPATGEHRPTPASRLLQTYSGCTTPSSTCRRGVSLGAALGRITTLRVRKTSYCLGY